MLQRRLYYLKQCYHGNDTILLVDCDKSFDIVPRPTWRIYLRIFSHHFKEKWAAARRSDHCAEHWTRVMDIKWSGLEHCRFSTLQHQHKSRLCTFVIPVASPRLTTCFFCFFLQLDLTLLFGYSFERVLDCLFVSMFRQQKTDGDYYRTDIIRIWAEIVITTVNSGDIFRVLWLTVQSVQPHAISLS